MSKWKQTSIGEFITFNPSESIRKGAIARKISMDKLSVYQRKINGSEFSEYSAGPKFRNGDTLVAKITPCLENGKTALVDLLDDEEVAFGSSEFMVLRENDSSDAKFIYYLARSPLFRERAISCMDGTSGRKRVNEGALKRQEIYVPATKTDQQKIAAVLSALDDKIELNNRINKELEQMAKTIYDYWFVQFDFPDANGKPYKSSGGKMRYDEVLKREVPVGWEVKKLGELGSFKNGVNYDPSSPGVTPCFIINVRNISNSSFFIKNEDLDIIYLNDSDVRKYSVNESSIVVARSGIPGATRLISDHFPNTLFCGFAIHYQIDNKSLRNLAFFFLKSLEEKIRNGSGGTIMKNVNQGVLCDLDLILPTEKVVLQFNRSIDTIFNKLINIERQNQKLSSLRDWLLPMLMNGQVRVIDVTKEYPDTEEKSGLSAESLTNYGETPKLNIPDSRRNFAKQVLAGKIVSEFRDDPNFTDIKFQKIQFLAEHIIKADLKLNYYYQAAGPYDNVFMHTIYNDFRKQKWFDCQNKRFVLLEKQEKIEEYFQEYFAPAQERLNKLFELLYQTTESEAEIIATLYAVWNNRIIERRTINDRELIQDFYMWSDRKKQYSEVQALEGLQWLRTHQMEPKGFGKLIKKAKK